MLEKPPARVGQRLLYLLGFCALAAFWVAMDWPCAIRTLTGVPCPGCGMSRAWLAVFRWDLSSAFSYHPMFWSIPVLGLFVLYDGQPLKSRRCSHLLLGLLLMGLLVCYILRLTAFFRGKIVY